MRGVGDHVNLKRKDLLIESLATNQSTCQPVGADVTGLLEVGVQPWWSARWYAALPPPPPPLPGLHLHGLRGGGPGSSRS